MRESMKSGEKVMVEKDDDGRSVMVVLQHTLNTHLFGAVQV